MISNRFFPPFVLISIVGISISPAQTQNFQAEAGNIVLEWEDIASWGWNKPEDKSIRPDQFPNFSFASWDPEIRGTITDTGSPCVFMSNMLDQSGRYRVHEDGKWIFRPSIKLHQEIAHDPSLIPHFFKASPRFTKIGFNHWIYDHQSKHGEPFSAEHVLAKLAAVEDFKVEDALSYVLPEFNAGDWNSRNHEEQLGEIENAVQTLINRYSEGRYIKWSQLGETYIGIADYEDYDRTPLNETLLEQRFFETLIYMDDPIVEYDEVMEGKRAIVLEPTFSRTGAHLIGKNEKSIIFLRAGFLFYDLGPHSFRHVAVSNMPSGILNAFVVNGYLYLFTEDSHPRGGQVKRARFPDLSPP